VLLPVGRSGKGKGMGKERRKRVKGKRGFGTEKQREGGRRERRWGCASVD